MPRRFAFLYVLFLMASAACAFGESAGSDSYPFRAFGSTSPYSVSAIDYFWFDSARGRQVPVRIYYPTGGDAEHEASRFPVVIFSTGLGRSRDDCAYLGRHWARCGYVSVHVQHIGSDKEVQEGSLRPRKELQKAFYAPQNIRNRPMDLIFVIDRLDSMQKEGIRPADRCDMTRIGVAGHDFGAQTVLALAGQVLPGNLAFDEPRIKAVVAISPPVPLGQVPLDLAYGDILRPCLYITGTADNSIVGTTQAPQRRLPFDHASGVDQYLITLKGADHMSYAGHLRAANGANDGMYQRKIAESTAVYWDAYLKGDSAAKAWLSGSPVEDRLGSIGWIERKPGGEQQVTAEKASERLVEK